MSDPHIVEFTLHGQEIRLYLPDPSDHIQRRIAERTEFYEPTLLQDVRARVHRGDLCLDVGAHLGNHTVFFARVCGMRVLAFEPQADLYRALRRNVELNHLDGQVRTFNVALGEAPGRGRMARALPDNTGTARLTLDDAGPVEVGTIDAHVGDERVALIKIDVEGFELEVLKGAERTLERDRPVIYAEAADAQSRESLEALLSPRGYIAVDQFAGTPVVVFVPQRSEEQRLAALAYRFSRAQKEITDGLRNRLKEDLRGQIGVLSEDLLGRLAGLTRPESALGRQLTGLGARSIALERRLARLESAVADLAPVLERLTQDGREHAALLYELWNLGAQSHAQAAPAGRSGEATSAYRPLNVGATDLAAWRPRRKSWTVPKGTNADELLQGYSGAISVHPGDEIDLRLSTDRVGLFARARVFGPGAALGARWEEVHASPPLYVPTTGVWRPDGGEVAAATWSVVHRFRIDPDWRPGCYIVRFETIDGKATLHHFWVTSPKPSASAVHLSAVMTHVARNRWGGADPHATGGRLRFGRPARPAAIPLLRPYRGARGSSLLRQELSLHRWADASALALDVVTDLEVHAHPELLAGYQQVVIAGDASYLSEPVIGALRAVREAGGRIAVLGAAPGQFQVDVDLEAGALSLRAQSSAERADWKATGVDLWRVGERWTHKGPPLDLELLPALEGSAGPVSRLPRAASVPGLCAGRLTSSTLSDDDPALLARAVSPDGERRCDTLAVSTDKGGSVFVAGTDRWFAALDEGDRDRPLPAEIAALTAAALGASEVARAEPLISVIMTAYDSASYIGRAIESILAQSHRTLELIVVDDASSDDTFQVLLRHAERDRRVRPYRSFQNHGTYWSKNFGMTVARGELVTFQDSDDSSDPDRLAIQLQQLRRKPGAIASIADYVRLSETGQLLLNRGAVQRRAFPSLLLRAEAIARVGYFDSVRTSADQEYFHRLRLAYSAEQIVEIRKPLYRALAREGSLTRSETSQVALGGGTSRRDRLAHLSDSRRLYVLAYEQWHQRIAAGEASPHLSFPLPSRPFQIAEDLDIHAGRSARAPRRGALLLDADHAGAADLEPLAGLDEVWCFVNGDGPDPGPAGVRVRTLRSFRGGGDPDLAFTFTARALPGADDAGSPAERAARRIVGIERRELADAGAGAPPVFNVILLSDFRFTGGTSHSNAEEITAQAALGLTTGLIQVDSPVLKHQRPVNPGIQRLVDAGKATFVAPGVVPRARLLLVRHPTVLMREQDDLPRVEAEHLAVIINQPPLDAANGQRWYDLVTCQARARERFGLDGHWLPIGPLVRRALEAEPSTTPIAAVDWNNIIDIAAWGEPRAGFVGDRPVLGRHSRDGAEKWPADPAEILAAYPDDDAVRVRILGGAGTPTAVLGHLPARWEVLPFGAMSARDFLAGIDFFVYFHHPDWVEAFGRTILEAMAAGVPAILPPHFADLFGDAAIYAEPAQVRGVIEDLYRDPARYQERSRRGLALVEGRFSHAAHARRLAELGVEARARAAELLGEADLEADSVYKVDVELGGLPPGARGAVRGLSRATGQALFELPLDGEAALNAFVVTRDRDHLEVMLVLEEPGPAPVAKVRISRRAERPKARGLELHDESITAAMATYPARRAIVPAVIDTLLPQVDRLFLYLNNYDEVPDFVRSHALRERIVFILDPASQKRAAAKFAWLDTVRGFHLICDDDILYPPDYAMRLCEAIDRRARQAIVGVHGIVYARAITDARSSRRSVHKFHEPLAADTPVHFLGTGTVGLHASTLARLDVTRFMSYPIANDEILAVSARAAGVPMICVARDEGWLRPHPDVRFGIFEERSIDSEEHARATELLASGNPWPELDGEQVAAAPSSASPG